MSCFGINALKSDALTCIMITLIRIKTMGVFLKPLITDFLDNKSLCKITEIILFNNWIKKTH